MVGMKRAVRSSSTTVRTRGRKTLHGLVAAIPAAAPTPRRCATPKLDPTPKRNRGATTKRPESEVREHAATDVARPDVGERCRRPPWNAAMAPTFPAGVASARCSVHGVRYPNDETGTYAVEGQSVNHRQRVRTRGNGSLAARSDTRPNLRPRRTYARSSTWVQRATQRKPRKALSKVQNEEQGTANEGQAKQREESQAAKTPRVASRAARHPWVEAIVVSVRSASDDGAAEATG
jgi:hypothetical protein